MTKKKDTEFIPILMADAIKACGKTQNSTARESSLVQKEYNAKENGITGRAFNGQTMAAQSTPTNQAKLEAAKLTI